MPLAAVASPRTAPMVAMLRRASAALLLATAACSPGVRTTSPGTVNAPTSAPVAPAPEPLPSAGTRRMAQRLEEIVSKADPMQNTFRNAERAAIARARLAKATDPTEALRIRMMLGWELLVDGRTHEAETELLALRNAVTASGQRLDAASLRQIRDFLITCYLRMGEQENCVAHHTTDSCLMPIKGGGVHGEQRGSRMAHAELLEALEEQPDDLRYRWLLNLVSMTLGEWPDGVPKAWRIGAERFASDIEFPRFYDAAPRMKLDHMGLSGGVVMEDLDGDGLLDIMISSFGVREQLRYFRAVGDGTFEDRTEAAGLIGELGGLNIIHADYDNDGDQDVFVLRGAWLKDQGHFPNSLLRNRGNGTFDDVTEAAGLLSFHPTQAGAWADFDNDGWLDLFIGNESRGAEPHPCELFHANGDGTFTDVASQVGLAHVGFVKGAAWGDYDNDGRPDIYLSCLTQPNHLFHSDGPGPGGNWTFTDVTERAGVAAPLRSFPTWFWDYDNDGWLDLFVGSYSAFLTDSLAVVVADVLEMPSQGERLRLYRNRHDGTFEDVSAMAGLDDVLLVMGANYGDLDNDGWQDCYLTTGDPFLTTLVPNRMYRNAEGRKFQDVTTAGGFGHLQKGHGVAFGDIDNDGDQDIYHVLGGAYSGDTYRAVLFENPGFGNHYITLQVTGTKSNRCGLGARIRVTIAEAGADRDIHALVSDGGSFGSSSIQQEIGLGKATALRSLEITWPTSGIVQRFQDVGMDAVYRVTEGEDQLQRLR